MVIHQVSSDSTRSTKIHTPSERLLHSYACPQQGRRVFYRLIHGENDINGLAIATLERLLEEAGVSMADLVEVTAAAAAR